MPLLEFSERGIYCRQAGVFIDPSNSVPRALITHAHSDHAAAGCQSYLSTEMTTAILRHRLGRRDGFQTVRYGERITIQGVDFSFHPAGHVAGSAQIRVSFKGEVWVVSGDYKTVDDGISGVFEPVPCETFVTESTFGLPVYQWPDQEAVYAEINAWWKGNCAAGLTSVVSAYSLGKAQRVISHLDAHIGKIYCHGAVENINEIYRSNGLAIQETHRLDDNVKPKELEGAIVITPGGALNTAWVKRFRSFRTAAVSGWMQLRGRKRWQNVDKGFVLSDHADWPGLNTAIRETGCKNVVVTHGYSELFARWLRSCGYNAVAETTHYTGEAE